MRFYLDIKKIFIGILLLIISLPLLANGHTVPRNEQLKYNVYFQIGFLWKKAAVASLSSKPIIYQSQPALQLNLSTITTPFFDKFMKVRDTMICITSSNIKPYVFSKVTHEEAVHGHENARYLYNSGQTTTRVQKITNRKIVKDTIRFHSGIQVFDMLSIFYYLRSMNMNMMVKNHTLRFIIVAGTIPYMIRINYKGTEVIQTPKIKRLDSHKVSFIFEYMLNKKVQRNELLLWLSNDGTNTPMMIKSELPIGSVKAYYEGVE